MSAATSGVPRKKYPRFRGRSAVVLPNGGGRIQPNVTGRVAKGVAVAVGRKRREDGGGERRRVRRDVGAPLLGGAVGGVGGSYEEEEGAHSRAAPNHAEGVCS